MTPDAYGLLAALLVGVTFVGYLCGRYDGRCEE